ncbi:hypothetical protein ACHAWO_002080 [Cyclotella atomus]|uniref:Peptidase M50 domain-containing protein n=1 Tax=Cyclotella atomus TaxID=382360 RepID=A0ABD3NZC1_9STRA
MNIMTESTETSNERRCISSESISLGSIRSIPITLHYSFFLLLIVELFISLRYTMYPMYILFILILYGPILLFTVVVHELGHAFTTKKMGGQVEGITLWPLGGFAVCGPTECGLVGDLKVAVMGPAMHIPMGLIWWSVWLGLSGGEKGLWPSWVINLPAISSSAAVFIGALASEAFYFNLMLFCFNLLIPAYPLDGGRIYAASLILYAKLQPMTAAKVTAATAILLSLGMVLYAFIGYFTDMGGSGLLLGVVGLFIFSNSYDLWKAAKNNDLDGHPIFGRRCYQSGGDAEAQEVPAQSDDAVIT